MEAARRKELLEQYKQRKPAMGVLGVLGPDERYHLEISRQVEALVNRTRFQLELGSHPYHALQKAWTAHSGNGFHIRVMKALPADALMEDDDPRDALDLLLMACQDELQAQGMQPY